MMKLLLSVIIGIAAGVIDVIPMFMQKLDRFSILSAFVQWIVVSIVIAYIDFNMPAPLKGLVVAVALALPVVILVAKTDVKSVIPILTMCIILGSIVGFVTEKLIK